MSHPALLALDHVSHAYGHHAVVKDLSFQLHPGEIGCLLGASGCGKTTVLRLIAGFETPTQGTIHLQDTVVGAPRHCVPAERRNIGMVFQDYALFPHLSVAGNIGFGLRGTAAAPRRIDELLAVVGLVGQGHKYPHELSGGQQQRVALARALAPRPHLLLLDEPFSNLDVELRERLSLEVRAILKETGTAAILVTHDQHEAFAVADVVGIMHAGRIEQWDRELERHGRLVGVPIPIRTGNQEREGARPTRHSFGDGLEQLWRSRSAVRHDQDPLVAHDRLRPPRR
jgi:iron(III) transport system ATP-binding protein